MEFTAKSVTDKVGRLFIKVLTTDDNGGSISRTLTLDQFIDVLGKSVKEEREYTLLKKDFFPAEARATWFSDYENYSCVWEVPASNRLLILHTALGDKHYHVPFPNLVFKIKVRSGMFTSKTVFAMKEGSDELFHYPFGNVSEQGSICMGNISSEDMLKVSEFSDAFFMGITNDDYYGDDGNGKVSIKISQEELLKRLEELDEFPDNWLSLDKSHTIKSLCEEA